MRTLRQNCAYEGINFYGRVAKRTADSAVWWIFKGGKSRYVAEQLPSFQEFLACRVSQLMGSMHKQILHTHTHTCARKHTHIYTSSSWKTPLYLGTADCELLSNKGFLGEECEVPSLLPWCLQLVMRQSRWVKLWEAMHVFWHKTSRVIFSHPQSSLLSLLS